MPWFDWSFKKLMMIAALGVTAILGALAFYYREDLALFAINPRQPYQLYEAPIAPQYDQPESWAIWPTDKTRGIADVFYVHATTYADAAHWNAPIDDPNSAVFLNQVAAPNQVGPFFPVGPVYAPRYRQATLYAKFTHKFDGLSARALAFEDVSKAFERFVEERHQHRDGRPMILVGYGQGGLHVQGLLQRYFAEDQTLRNQLAAAYVIDEPTPLSVFDNGLASTPPCKNSTDTRCVIGYLVAEPSALNDMREFKKRSLVHSQIAPLTTGLQSLGAEQLLCVNPLNWAASVNGSSALVSAQKSYRSSVGHRASPK